MTDGEIKLYENVQPSTLIKVLDASTSKFEETELSGKPVDKGEAPYPKLRNGRRTINPELFEGLKENVQLSVANFPDLLRSGIQFDAFTSYNETPVVWNQIARTVTSNSNQEEYMKDAALGIAPIVFEGAPYPEVVVSTGDSVIVRNYKRGYIIPVTEEIMRFDKLGKVRQIADLVGRSIRLTEEVAVMDVLTTSSNYTRTLAAGDNDEGNNTAATAFSAAGLITAFNTLTTMKDRKSGLKLGVRPDTLVISPKLRWAAYQLIRSPQAMRVGGNTTNEIYGGGTDNQFFDLVRNIIVSPYFGSSYEWCLLEAKRGLVFQQVEPFQLLRENMDATNGNYITYDTIRYRARTWFGTGMVDDRFAFLSTSSSAPVIS
jgi:hypothetical protein